MRRVVASVASLFIILTGSAFQEISATAESAAGVCGRSTIVRVAIERAYNVVDSLNGCRALTNEHLAGITTLDLYGSFDLSSIAYYNLRESYFEGFIPSDFAGLTELRELTLGANTVATLPHNAFRELHKLEKLYVTDNYLLESIDAEVFSQTRWFSNPLRELYIDGSSLTHLENDSFSELVNLQVLELSGGHMRALDAELFDSVTNLQELHVERNPYLSSLTGSFSDLEKLQKLNLSNNALFLMDEGFLDGLTGLQELNLENNELRHLHDGDFDDLVDLTTLKLANNFMAVQSVLNGGPLNLASDLLDNLDSLETLDISNNFWDSDQIPEGFFDDVLDSLTDLDFSPASWEEVFSDHPLCPRTPQVRAVILESLTGSEHGGREKCYLVPASGLDARLALIETMDISEEGITALRPGDFAGLSGLQTLNLGDNDLVTLPAGIFDGLGGLQMLNLENNSLAALSADVFDDLSELQTLDMENNSLAALPVGIFDNLGALQTLVLSDNTLTGLVAAVLDGLNSLRTLHLESNPRLTHLPPGVFDPVLGTLIDLTLDDAHKVQEVSVSVSPEGDIETGESVYIDVSMDRSSPVRLVFPYRFTRYRDVEAPGSSTAFGFVVIDAGETQGSVVVLAIDFRSHLPGDTIEVIIESPFPFFSDPQTVSKNDIFNSKYLDLTAPSLYLSSLGDFDRSEDQYTLQHVASREVDVCGRSPQVRDAIMNKINAGIDCDAVTFSHMVRIESLSISDPIEGFLHRDDFADLPNLRSLALHNNSVPRQPVHIALDNNTGVARPGYKVGQLELENLADLERLETLDLSSNNLAKVVRGPAVLPYLRELDLSDNNLSTVYGMSIRDMDFLKRLDLSNNNLGGEGDYSGLRWQLSNNDARKTTPPIGWLDLSGNGFEELNPSDFYGFDKLKSLDLSDNSLSDLSANHFRYFDSIESLDLRGNDSLESLPPGVFQSMLDSLTHLHLDEALQGEVFFTGEGATVAAGAAATVTVLRTKPYGSMVVPITAQVSGGGTVVLPDPPVVFFEGGRTSASFEVVLDAAGVATLELGAPMLSLSPSAPRVAGGGRVRETAGVHRVSAPGSQAVATLTADANALQEGNQVRLKVELDVPLAAAVVFHLALEDVGSGAGYAVMSGEGADAAFQSSPARVRIPAGEVESDAVLIDLIPDAFQEPDEVFSVKIDRVAVSGRRVLMPQVNIDHELGVTIARDGAPVSDSRSMPISVTGGAVWEGRPSALMFTLGGPGYRLHNIREAEIHYEISGASVGGNNPAEAEDLPVGGVVRIAGGNYPEGRQERVDLAVVDDVFVEGDEHAQVTITEASFSYHRGADNLQPVFYGGHVVIKDNDLVRVAFSGERFADMRRPHRVGPGERRIMQEVELHVSAAGDQALVMEAPLRLGDFVDMLSGDAGGADPGLPDAPDAQGRKAGVAVYDYHVLRRNPAVESDLFKAGIQIPAAGTAPLMRPYRFYVHRLNDDPQRQEDFLLRLALRDDVAAGSNPFRIGAAAAARVVLPADTRPDSNKQAFADIGLSPDMPYFIVSGGFQPDGSPLYEEEPKGFHLEESRTCKRSGESFYPDPRFSVPPWSCGRETRLRGMPVYSYESEGPINNAKLADLVYQVGLGLLEPAAEDMTFVLNLREEDVLGAREFASWGEYDRAYLNPTHTWLDAVEGRDAYIGDAAAETDLDSHPGLATITIPRGRTRSTGTVPVTIANDYEVDDDGEQTRRENDEIFFLGIEGRNAGALPFIIYGDGVLESDKLQAQITRPEDAEEQLVARLRSDRNHVEEGESVDVHLDISRIPVNTRQVQFRVKIKGNVRKAEASGYVQTKAGPAHNLCLGATNLNSIRYNRDYITDDRVDIAVSFPKSGPEVSDTKVFRPVAYAVDNCGYHKNTWHGFFHDSNWGNESEDGPYINYKWEEEHGEIFYDVIIPGRLLENYRLKMKYTFPIRIEALADQHNDNLERIYVFVSHLNAVPNWREADPPPPPPDGGDEDNRFERGWAPPEDSTRVSWRDISDNGWQIVVIDPVVATEARMLSPSARSVREGGETTIDVELTNVEKEDIVVHFTLGGTANETLFSQRREERSGVDYRVGFPKYAVRKIYNPITGAGVFTIPAAAVVGQEPAMTDRYDPRDFYGDCYNTAWRMYTGELSGHTEFFEHYGHTVFHEGLTPNDNHVHDAGLYTSTILDPSQGIALQSALLRLEFCLHWSWIQLHSDPSSILGRPAAYYEPGNTNGFKYARTTWDFLHDPDSPYRAWNVHNSPRDGGGEVSPLTVITCRTYPALCAPGAPGSAAPPTSIRRTPPAGIRPFVDPSVGAGGIGPYSHTDEDGGSCENAPPEWARNHGYLGYVELDVQELEPPTLLELPFSDTDGRSPDERAAEFFRFGDRQWRDSWDDVLTGSDASDCENKIYRFSLRVKALDDRYEEGPENLNFRIVSIEKKHQPETFKVNWRGRKQTIITIGDGTPARTRVLADDIDIYHVLPVLPAGEDVHEITILGDPAEALVGDLGDYVADASLPLRSVWFPRRQAPAPASHGEFVVVGPESRRSLNDWPDPEISFFSVAGDDLLQGERSLVYRIDADDLADGMDDTASRQYFVTDYNGEHSARATLRVHVMRQAQLTLDQKPGQVAGSIGFTHMPLGEQVTFNFQLSGTATPDDIATPVQLTRTPTPVPATPGDGEADYAFSMPDLQFQDIGDVTYGLDAETGRGFITGRTFAGTEEYGSGKILWRLPRVGDSRVEKDETITIQLISLVYDDRGGLTFGSDAEPIVPTALTFTLTDNDLAVATLTLDPAVVREGEDFTAILSLDKPVPEDVTFTLTLHEDGPADTAGDVTGPDTLVLPAGEQTVRATFEAVEDLHDTEGEETVRLAVSAPMSSEGSVLRWFTAEDALSVGALVNIADAPPPWPTAVTGFQVQDAGEGHPLAVTVTLNSRVPEAPVETKITYRVVGGSGDHPIQPEDVAGALGDSPDDARTVTLPVGAITHTFQIETITDAIIEHDQTGLVEIIHVRMTDPGTPSEHEALSIEGIAAAPFTIADATVAHTRIRPDNSGFVVEGDPGVGDAGGFTTITLQASLADGMTLERPLGLSLFTGPSAPSGEGYVPAHPAVDYEFIEGGILLLPGMEDEPIEFTLRVIPDLEKEGGETFDAWVGGADDSILADRATVIIIDDEAQVSSFVKVGDATEPFSSILPTGIAGEFLLTVTGLSPAAGESAQIHYTFSSPTGATFGADQDYTASFGVAGGPQTVLADASGAIPLSSANVPGGGADGNVDVSIGINPANVDGDRDNEVVIFTVERVVLTGADGREFALTLGAQGGGAASASLPLVIRDAWNLPEIISFSASTIAEGESADSAVVEAVFGADLPADAMATYTLSPHSTPSNDAKSASPGDYYPQGESTVPLSAVPGKEKTYTFPVTITDDSNIETIEEAVLAVTEISWNDVSRRNDGSRETAILTITDNDALEVGFESASWTFAEEDADAHVGLTVSGSVLPEGYPRPVVVNLVPSQGGNTPATAGEDFSRDPVAVTIPPGDYTDGQTVISAPFNAIINDSNSDANMQETFIITVEGADGRVTQADLAQATIIIEDDETIPIARMERDRPGDSSVISEPYFREKPAFREFNIFLENIPFSREHDLALRLGLGGTADRNPKHDWEDFNSVSYSSANGREFKTHDYVMATQKFDNVSDLHVGAEMTEFTVLLNPVYVNTRDILPAIQLKILPSTDGHIEKLETIEISIIELRSTAPGASPIISRQRSSTDSGRLRHDDPLTMAIKDKTPATKISSVTVDSTSVEENDGEIRITVSINGRASVSLGNGKQTGLTLPYAITGTVSADDVPDFPLEGNIYIPLGDREKTIVIGIKDDFIDEPDETLTFSLTGLPLQDRWGETLISLAAGEDGEEEITIIDSDFAPTAVDVSVDTRVIYESGSASASGDLSGSGASASVVTVRLDSAVLEGQSASLPYSLAESAAVFGGADADYTLAVDGVVVDDDDPMTLVFLEGEQVKEVTITAVDDSAIEEEREAVVFALVEGSYGGIEVEASDREEIDIVSDDSSGISLVPMSYTFSEDGGDNNAMVLVGGNMSGDTTVVLTASVAAWQTATIPDDVAPVARHVIPAGFYDSQMIAVEIGIEDDASLEDGETFTLTLTVEADWAPEGGVILGNTESAATISLSDSATRVEEFTIAQAAVEEDSDLELSLTLDRPVPAGYLTINYMVTTHDRYGRVSDEDFTDINLNTGNPSDGVNSHLITLFSPEKTFAFDISVNDDNRFEPTEKGVITLAGVEWRGFSTVSIDADNTVDFSIIENDKILITATSFTEENNLQEKPGGDWGGSWMVPAFKITPLPSPSEGVTEVIVQRHVIVHIYTHNHDEGSHPATGGRAFVGDYRRWTGHRHSAARFSTKSDDHKIPEEGKLVYIPVQIYEDHVFEPYETFLLSLRAPAGETGIVFEEATVIVTIADDDGDLAGGPTDIASVSASAIREGGPANGVGTATVTFNNEVPDGGMVTYTISSAGARGVESADFVGGAGDPGTFTVPLTAVAERPHAYTFPITVADDDLIEGSEDGVLSVISVSWDGGGQRDFPSDTEGILAFTLLDEDRLRVEFSPDPNFLFVEGATGPEAKKVKLSLSGGILMRDARVSLSASAQQGDTATPGDGTLAEHDFISTSDVNPPMQLAFDCPAAGTGVCDFRVERVGLYVHTNNHAHPFPDDGSRFVEEDETFTLTLSTDNPSVEVAGPVAIRATIRDRRYGEAIDPTAVTISIGHVDADADDPATSENISESEDVSVTFTLDQYAPADATVVWQVRANSADGVTPLGDGDIAASLDEDQITVIPQAETSVTVTLDIIDDNIIEAAREGGIIVATSAVRFADDTPSIPVSSFSGAGTFTIADNDKIALWLEHSEVKAGVSPLRYTIGARAAPEPHNSAGVILDRDITAVISSRDISARSPDDYAAVSETLTFLANESIIPDPGARDVFSQTIDIEIVGDDDRQEELFQLYLSHANDAGPDPAVIIEHDGFNFVSIYPNSSAAYENLSPIFITAREGGNRVTRALDLALSPNEDAVVSFNLTGSGGLAGHANHVLDISVNGAELVADLNGAGNFTIPAGVRSVPITFTARAGNDQNIEDMMFTITGIAFSDRTDVTDIGALSGLPIRFLGAIDSSGICDRTKKVQDVILAMFAGSSCAEITGDQLRSITELSIDWLSVAEAGEFPLDGDDFDGLTQVHTMSLRGKNLGPRFVWRDGVPVFEPVHVAGLDSLPAGLFDGLASLRVLELVDNNLGDSGDLPDGVFDDVFDTLTDLTLDDALKSIVSFSNATSSIDEGATATITVTRTLPYASVMVPVSAAGGGDIILNPPIVSFVAGETHKTIEVSASDPGAVTLMLGTPVLPATSSENVRDAVVEVGNIDTHALTIGDSVAGEAGGTMLRGASLRALAPVPAPVVVALEIASQETEEGDNIAFTIRLDRATGAGQTAMLLYEVAGSGRYPASPDDWQAVSGRTEITAGEAVDIVFATVDDERVEEDETVTVRVTGGDYGGNKLEIQAEPVEVTIVDNDVAETGDSERLARQTQALAHRTALAQTSMIEELISNRIGLGNGAVRNDDEGGEFSVDLADSPQDMQGFIGDLSMESVGGMDMGGHYALWVQGHSGSVDSSALPDGLAFTDGSGTTGMGVGMELSQEGQTHGVLLSMAMTGLTFESESGDELDWDERMMIVAPYFSGEGPGVSVWASAGMGRGTIDFSRGEGAASTETEMVFFMGSGSLERLILGGLETTVAGGVQAMRKEVEGHRRAGVWVSEVASDAAQVDGLIRFAWPVDFEGGVVQPYTELVTAYQLADMIGGDRRRMDAKTGISWLYGEWDISLGMTAALLRDSASQWNAKASMEYGKSAHGVKFSATLLHDSISQWSIQTLVGYRESDDGAGLSLELEGVQEVSTISDGLYARSNRAWEAGFEGGYGMSAGIFHPDGLLTPFARIDQKETRRNIAAGMRFSVGNQISFDVQKIWSGNHNSVDVSEYRAGLRGGWAF